jgi:hypothetical protein
MIACTHLDRIHQITSSSNGCEECLRGSDTWVHLRECLIVRSFQRGESRRWCYVDEILV